MISTRDMPASTRAVLLKLLSKFRESEKDTIALIVAYSQGNNEVANALLERFNYRLEDIDALFEEIDVN